jgi:two-component system, cell cycle response regulator PopA
LRIVVRSDDPRLVREAQAKLVKAGLAAMALPSLSRAAPDGEDVSLFCGADALELARAAMTRAHPPLAALAARTNAPALGLDAAPGAIALDAPPRLLAAQFDAQVRVAVQEEEAARRALTLSELGMDAPPPPAPRALKALYIGAPTAAFLALERVLGEQDGAIVAAFSSFVGFDHLHDETFDAVILNGADDAKTALSLCTALRRNTALFHLPAMVLTAPGDSDTLAIAYERGASFAAPAPDACGGEIGWLFEAIRRERRRVRAEHALRALRDLMGDTRTGLFQPAPFEAHLARLAADHQRSGRPFALVALRATPAFGAGEPSEAAWRRGFSEVSSLAARLLREGDCGAALGRDLIVLALPASDLGAARGTVERIAAVAECTAFAAGDNGGGPLAFERSAVELQPGESGAGLLARALRNIDPARVSA